MDPPYIHQSRYVPISPPTPSNPNLYRHEIYLPPPPQQQQLLPPPPPPAETHQLHHHHHHRSSPHTFPSPVHNVSFNSHHSQFQFSPKFSPSPNPNPQNRYHHQRSNNFSHRISTNDDLQQQKHQQNDHHHHHRRQRFIAELDARSDVWDRPPRNLPDDRPVVSNLYRRQFDHQPMSPYRPTDKLKHEYDSSYRFRERYSNDGVKFEYTSSNNSNQSVEFVPHLSHFVSDSDRLNSSSYDNRQHGSQFGNNELMRNNVRDVVLDRQVLSDRDSHDSVFGRGSNLENGGDGVRIFSAKREFNGSDSVRCGNNRGSRENSYYEYNKTPRKQVQRKSALLRIQKPYYRNRDDGELHNSSCEMKYGSFRGKDQGAFSDREVGEDKQKERSHVELDVSFKSNTLVAKAIMAPSSSAIASDANLTPKKRNTRKIMMSDKDHSSSPTKKPLDNRRCLDCSRDAVSNVSGSGNKDSKQTVKKVAPSVANMRGNNSQPCARGNDNLPAKITVEKWGTDVATTKTPSLKVTKKKKIVKKVLKKAINPMAHVSSFQPTEKLDEPVKANGSTLDATAAPVLKMGVKPSKDQITCAAMTSCHLGDLQPYTNEANKLPRNDQVGGSPHVAMVSKEVSTHSDSCLPCVTKFKRKRSGSLSPLASSSLKDTETEGSVHADNCLHALHTTSNTDKDLTKLLNKNIFSDCGSFEAANKQFCHNHNGHSLLLENSETKESPETLLSEGRNINSDLLSLEENIRHEVPVNTCSFLHGTNTTTSSNNGLLSSHEKMANSEVGILNASSKQPCKGQISFLVNNSALEGSPLVTLPGRCEISASSSSVETGIHNVSIHADCSNCDKCSVSGSDNVNTYPEEINSGNDDYNDRQLATNEDTISLENGAAEGFLKTLISVGSSEEDMSNNTDKSKVMTSLSDSPMISDIYMGPVQPVSSVKDCCPAEVRITEGLDYRGRNSTGGCCEANVSDSSDLNGASPANKKRRKVSASHTGFTSTIVSEISEGPATPELSTSGVIQPEEGVAVSNMDALCDSSLPPCPDGITVLLENSSAQVSSEVAVSVSRDVSGVGDDSLKVEPQRADSSSDFGESDTSNALSTCLPGSESKQILNENPVLDGSSYKNEVMYMENNESENMDVFVVKEQVKACSEATEFGTPPGHQSPNLNEILPATDVKSDGCLFEKGDLPSASTNRALAGNGDGISTTKSNDELMEFDSLSNMGSPEILSTVSVLSTLNLEPSSSQNSNERVYRVDKKPNEKHVHEGTSNSSANTSSTENANINSKLDYLLESTHSVASRTALLPAQDVKGAGHNLNPTGGETSRIHPRSLSSVFIASRNVASSTRTTRARTWHRTESSAAPAPGNKSFLPTVHPPNQLPKKVAKFQNMSYIRKGNSLVRKPAPVAAVPQAFHCFTPVYQSNSLGICESKKTHGSYSGVDVIDPPNFLRMGGVNALLERPRVPPPLPVAAVPNHATNSTGDCRTSPVAEPLPNCFSVMTSDPQKLMEINDEPNSSNDALKISETLEKKTGSINSLETMESQDEFIDGSLSTSNVKKITYLKRKSNQLIVASNDCGLSVQSSDKTQSTISDGCYKRHKNQLIRTPMESHINQTVSLADGSFTSKRGKCPKDIFRRSSNKNQSYKAVKKIHKPLRFSLVWTLNSMQSSKNDDCSSYRQKVLPYLFPWKRTVYWRRFAQDSVSTSNNISLSAISRKLLLLRKRDTVYTRSNHGFSLRKSKVLSVGGSSLKWSKSIENHSKKANEEATLAVAAVEKKRQQNGAELFASETKNRSSSCRERIFRIGSVRYKKRMLLKLLTLLAVASLLIIPSQSAVSSVDLGSEWLKVAVVNLKPGQSPIAIAINEMSKRKSPALVAFQESTRLLAEEAAGIIARYPHGVYSQLRDMIGKPYKQVKHLIDSLYLPFDIIEDSRGAVSFKIDDNTYYSVEELLAMVLSYAVNLADAHTKLAVKDFVVSVPPYFGQAERKGLLQAAELAGMNVLSLLNEHSGAALQYGIDKDFSNESRHVVFYDMGATTTYAALIYFSAYNAKEYGKTVSVNQFQVKDVRWDAELGGQNMELRLVEYFADEFNKQVGDGIDVRKSPKAMAKLKKQVKRTKEILSANTMAPISVESLYDDRDFRSSITRQKFEELCEDLWERSLVPLKEVLKHSGLKMDQIYAVELIGGATRVPKLQAKLQEFLGRTELDRHLDADEAIVLGAALHAANLSDGIKLNRKLGMVDGSSYGFVVELDGPELQEDESARRLLAPRMKKFPSKMFRSIIHTKDFEVSLAYESEDLLPPGVISPVFAKYAVSGLADASEKYSSRNLSSPIKANLHFSLSRGGVLSLDRADAVIEITEWVEVPKKNLTVENATSSPNVSVETVAQNTTEEAVENLQPANGTSNASTSTAEESNNMEFLTEKKLKKRTFRVPLKIVEKTVGPGASLSNEALADAEAKLEALDKKDAERRRTAELKNNLEGYIYATKEKFETSEDFEKVSTSEERQSFIEKLDEAQEWLYTDGEDAPAKEFQERLDILKAVGDPIFFRFKELTARPAAVDNAQKYLGQLQQTVHDWETKKPWLPKDRIDEVLKDADKFKSWLDEKENEQKKTSGFSKPVFTSEEVYEKILKLQDNINIINRIPKPKPKPEKKPKKNETESSAENAKDSNTSEKKPQKNETESSAENAKDSNTYDKNTIESDKSAAESDGSAKDKVDPQPEGHDEL